MITPILTLLLILAPYQTAANQVSDLKWSKDSPIQKIPLQRAFFSCALTGDSTNVYSRSLRRTLG